MLNTYRHTISGATFTTNGHAGPFGASVSGRWNEHGTEGVIFPGETLKDGSPVWVNA